MKYPLLSTALVILLGVQTAVAASPGYNYTELGYVYGQFKASQPANDSWYQQGGQVDASYAIKNRYWLSASYTDTQGDKQGNTPESLRLHSAIVRAGYIFYPTENLSIDIAALWRFDNPNAPLINNSGPGASLGLRANVAAFELFGRGAYLGKDFDGGYSANAGAIWHWTENFGLSAGYQRTHYRSRPADAVYDTEQLNLGIRFTFPPSR